MTKLPPFKEECFFITPIGSEGTLDRSRADQVLKHIVAPAAKTVGLSVVRADQISEPGHITLQVIDHCIKARAAVADLTGANPNVFYELGIRHTAQLPVVLISEIQSLPFDLAQLRTVFYDHKDLDSAERCRTEVEAQLASGLRKGTTSPVATSQAFAKLTAGDPLGRTIAAMLTAMEGMTSRFQRVEDELERLSDTIGVDARGFDPEGYETMVFDWVAYAISLLAGSTRKVMIARLGLAGTGKQSREEVAKRLKLTEPEVAAIEQQAFAVWEGEGFRDEYRNWLASRYTFR